VTWDRMGNPASMTYTESPPADIRTAKPAARGKPEDLPLVEALAAGSGLQDQLYVRYRRPLLQIFLHRRIARDAAEDLLQRTFERAVKKIRTEGLEDPSNLGGYLYRTALNLATIYLREGRGRQYDSDRELIANLKDEALSVEERLGREQLAKCVREFLGHLPQERDREVLERYYLHEEPRTAIRESLQLTDVQFNQVLWRARQRFGDILRGHGFAHAGSVE
jgi:RNA polymerase sigma factor (sigma-70 family)